MPEYSFVCNRCHENMYIICPIKDYDTVSLKLKCSLCGSKNIIRDYKTDIENLNTSIRKSDSELKTIGDLAKRNSEKFSEDKKKHLHEKHNSYKENKIATQDLPSGMTRIKKQQKTKWPQ